MMEAHQEEEKPTSVDTKTEVAQKEEVTVENVVKPVNGQRKWHMAKIQAAGRLGEPKN
jgi:hypothetical protein